MEMKLTLILCGATAWLGVAALAVLMARTDQPVLGFVPIAVAVFLAWGVGEVITDRLITVGSE
jgi:hypothetical protein